MNENNEVKIKDKKRIDMGKILGKVMAGILVCLMLFSVVGSLIYALI